MITLPITDPVLIFALAMLIFVSVPLLFERVRVPGVIGLIVAGAIIGPNALRLLDRGPTIILLGTVGLLYLMFMIGLELDLHEFRRYRNRSLVFGSLSFLIPQVIGTGFGLIYGYGVYSALLLGAVFASHTVLAYPIASRLGIVKNLAVTTTLGGTILTEILALLVLAIAAAGAGGSIGWEFWLSLLVSLSVYVAGVLWGVPRLARWFFRNVRSEPTFEFVFVLTVLFGVAYLAHAAHVEPIIGALLAGLALNRLIPASGPLMNRIHFVGTALFIPFFLLSVGMLVDLRALSTLDAWLFASGLAAAVIASKWAASWVTERVFGYTSAEGWVVFGLSVPHAAGTLAIMLVGFGAGLFDQSEVNGVVLTILVTCLVGPWAVERYGRQVALAETRAPAGDGSAPQRILIPIANPGTEDALLDLAMALRDGASDEPLYPLMVVREPAENAATSVAEAEKMLMHAVLYAAGADVPVVPLTRVDQNIAAGIARGMAETRSSMVVVGWDGGRATASTEIFGSVLDQLLEQTRQAVVVAKLGHPLNTTKRIVLVLPPLMHRHPGFPSLAGSAKTVASRLGASVLALVMDDDPARAGAALESARPAAPVTVEKFSAWGNLRAALRDRVEGDDLVIAFSARRGTLPWHPKLERLPGELATLTPGSFLIFFPPEADTSLGDDLPATPLPSGLRLERIVRDLPPLPFTQALREVLGSGPAAGSSRTEEIVAALVAGVHEFPAELRPGVVVPHARVPGIHQPILYLGTSREGIHFPHTREPAKAIFVLLSPVDQPQEHLRTLAEIARLVSHEEALRELLDGAPDPGAEGVTDGRA